MISSKKSRVLGLLGLSAAGIVGCSTTTPPRELADARAAYTRAASGPAPQLKPDTLIEAKRTLNTAERAFSQSADDRDVATLGYVAQRRSELADVQARNVMNEQEQAQAENEIQQIAAQRMSQPQPDMSQKLEQAQRAQTDAERRAREALDKLGQVRDEARGTVLTLPGQVMFYVGKATLLPGARQKLNQVADALRDETDHSIMVEGYTDSTGSDQTNEILSQKRADAVRDYLVAHGIKADMIKARGQGKSNPIATNATATGRAMNRRVEIVVENPPSR